MAVPTAQLPLTIPPPLRLPSGSVRAAMALILSGSLWYLVLNEQAVPPILADAALLVVAFYFGVRSTAPVVPLGSAGTAAKAQPWHLPRGSFRTLLILGFLGVTLFIWFAGRSLPPTLILVLQVLASYVTGYVFSTLLLLRVRAGKGLSRGVAAVRSGISLLVLGITTFVCGSILAGRLDLVPPVLENGLAWTIAFYFGSRIGP